MRKILSGVFYSVMLVLFSIYIIGLIRFTENMGEFRNTPNDLYCDQKLVQKPVPNAHWFYTTSQTFEARDNGDGVTMVFLPPEGVACVIRQQANK